MEMRTESSVNDFHRLLVEDGYVVVGTNDWFRFLVIPAALSPAFGAAFYQYQHPETTRHPPTLLELALLAGLILLLTLLLMLCFGRSVRIDAGGVTEKFLWRTRQLSWRQIRDYGYSYGGFGRARLYFADEWLEPSHDGRKKSAGKTCAILLRPSELKQSGRILNVCREYTQIRPYLCSQEGKLVGKLKDR
jgi:hypothetical protein